MYVVLIMENSVFNLNFVTGTKVQQIWWFIHQLKNRKKLNSTIQKLLWLNYKINHLSKYTPIEVRTNAI